jgi:hypothetical protein
MLPRTQLLAGERSFAGADSLSSQDVLVLIQAAVPAIAGAYAAHADQEGPPTRGGVLSAFFRQWREDNPGAAESEFFIGKTQAFAVLQARPSWEDALRTAEGGDTGEGDAAARLCKVARKLLDGKTSHLGGNIPEKVRKKKQLQTYGRWEGVVAWSQAPDIEDGARQARREEGMRRLDSYLGELVAQRPAADLAATPTGNALSVAADTESESAAAPTATALSGSLAGIDTACAAAASTPPATLPTPR